MNKMVYTIKSAFGYTFNYIFENGIITNNRTGETFPCGSRIEFMNFIHERVEDAEHRIIGIAG